MLSLSPARLGLPASTRIASPTLTARLLPALGIVLLSLGTAASAQIGPKPTELSPSKIDVYGGYGYILPFGSVSAIGGYEFQPVHNLNGTVSITDYFWKNLGVQLDGAYFNGGSKFGEFGQCYKINCSPDAPDPMYYTLGIGPVMRFPKGRFVPYVKAEVGPARINGPYLQPLEWGEQVTAGAGLDYVLPFFSNRLALRAEGDFAYMHVNYGGPPSDTLSGGVADVLAFRESEGIVFRFGSELPPVPVALACSVAPASIYPGDPVTVTGTATGLNPKKKAVYTYASTGGVVSPSGETATIDTKGLTAGSYTVSGTVSEGPKPREMASCSALFAVKAYEPPTLSCSASPSTLTAGDTATITSSGVSPQNRPLTYSYTASSGQITGSGATVTLATSGLPAGTIDVTCNVVDDLGQKATAQTSVTIQGAAPLPPKPTSQSLCSIGFDRDKKRPTRVDNEGKACLDDLALSLQRSTDATLDVVGNAASAEEDGTTKAAERAVNTKDYLVKEKGIDASRIAVFTGTDNAKVVTTTLVPSGAAPVTATPVDENAVKPQPRKPLGMRHHAKKKKK